MIKEHDELLFEELTSPSGTECPPNLFSIDIDKSLKIQIDVREEYGILFTGDVPWTLRRLWGADVWYGKIPFCKTLLLINIIVWLLQ